MSKTFHIARFDGDGIGEEIMREAVKAIGAVVDLVGGFACEMESLPAGAALYRNTGEAFPQASRRAARDADAILLAAMGLPEVTKPDGTEVQGVDAVLRAGHLTADVGGSTRTSEFGDLVVDALRALAP